MIFVLEASVGSVSNYMYLHIYQTRFDCLSRTHYKYEMETMPHQSLVQINPKSRQSVGLETFGIANISPSTGHYKAGPAFQSQVTTTRSCNTKWLFFLPSQP
ncbi:uncharacterized protein LAJ45_10447 [Morchella importuna]|uniref:uncharacterized protein n=1 Tax=Morchella importuna TaxID=1174673 RepID=UPI001E8E607F|nr:uncharacterized protein LAJ45_10447 [Morchella importuna]KAH8145477.1 hypothetical protein LAJ45_10447 [Morchella importuna]